MSARITFENQLEELNTQLIKMGTMVEDAIESSIDALMKRDKDQARDIMKGDRQVDEMEKQIEAQCLHIMLRQQPVAKDLRAVSAALKMITDMERIGDQAADIAEITCYFDVGELIGMANLLPKMAAEAITMVHDSINSFVKFDLELARKTMEHDDIVDEYFMNIRNELKQALKTSHQHADQAIDVLMIAKYLERIADHAVNICEWVVFSRTGEVFIPPAL